MKKLNLTVCEKMLLALLGSALHGSAPDAGLFEGVSADDWRLCARLAAKQGVLAVAWDGVVMLPPALQPPSSLKISWALAVEKYEKEYERYCNVALSFTQVCERHGVRPVLLKGVGFSTCYPVPSHREGGDIDFYVLSVKDGSCAGEVVDALMEKLGVAVDHEHSLKHSNFYYKGIPFENHKSFLDVALSDAAKSIEPLLEKLLDARKVELLSDRYVYVPSPEFNTLFIAFHAAQHYGAGIALHHLFDWACLLKKYGLHIPASVTDRHFIKGVNAFTLLCNEFLGTSVPVDGCERLALQLMEEILHPHGARKCPADASFLQKFLFKVRQYRYLVPINNSILYVPLWRNTIFWTNIKDAFGWKFSCFFSWLRGKRG